jgi:hypothetical protein
MSASVLVPEDGANAQDRQESGLLDSIEAWGSFEEVHFAGELVRGLEEFGRQKFQEMRSQADLVLRAYEWGRSEGEGHMGEIMRAVKECEGCVGELRRILAGLPGLSLD